MAFFGDLGRALNLETKEVFQTIGATLLGGPEAGVRQGIKSVVTPIPQQQQGQAVAVDRPMDSVPRETQASGTTGISPGQVGQVGGTYFPRTQAPMMAGFGLAAPLTQLARRYAPEIIGGLGIGAVTAAAPVVMDAFSGEPRKLRVTRKLKRLIKESVDNFGLEATSQASGLSQDVIMYIYTKKMRNDGPYVTKAAVRKTRQTVRKMKNLCDMYDDLRPAAKRRAPTRRAAGTRVTQIKQ